MPAVADSERRRFLQWIGQWSVIAAIATQIGGVVRALVPRVVYEPSKKFKLGTPAQYPEGITFVAAHRLFVVRERNQFHVISATCTRISTLSPTRITCLKSPSTCAIGRPNFRW